MSNNQQRRIVFIKRDFQLRFIFGAFSLILLAGFCSALLVYSITADDLNAQSLSVHTNLEQASNRLGLSVMMGNIVSILVAGAVAVFSVLYGSHKLAGPLYRFETLCRQVASGNLDGITKLREKDQLQELAESFAEMVDKLREQRHLRGKAVADINDQIVVLQGCSNLTEDQQEAVAKIVKLLQGLEP